MFHTMSFFKTSSFAKGTATNAIAIIVCCSWLVILETFFSPADKREHFNINQLSKNIY